MDGLEHDQLEAIRRATDVLFEEGQTVELRALKVPTEGGRTTTFSGYFDDFEALEREAARLDRKGAKGVYVTPNPIRPDLLARRKNKAHRYRKGDSLTKNEDITRRRWLLIDFDPERPAGISSTTEELEAARERALEVSRFLKERDWPGGVLAESGNGAHLLYRVDLPADDQGLTRRVLKALAEKFTGDLVELDTSVHNAARIWKLYGTTARKGDPTEERPHRRARILRVADNLKPVLTRKLRAVVPEPANERKAAPRRSQPAQKSGESTRDLSVEEVEEALSFIPARPDYPEWIRIIAAVHDAVGDALTAETLLKAWSPEEEPGEYRKKLNSGLNEITAGTLIHEAKRHGYIPPWKRQNVPSRHRMNGRAKNGAHSAQRPIHGSRSPKDCETVNEAESAPQATPLFGFGKPDPLEWTVLTLIPKNHISLLAADGGTGKSFLAIYLALCIALGRAFFGRDTQRGRVLYVDYELDAEEQKRRVWRVAEGMRLSVNDERLEERLFYFRPTAPLGTKEAHDEVMHLIEKYDIDFVVLDSLTVGSAGADVTASEDVVPMMQSLREWGTVLAIDHISSNAARGNQSQATPFGSVFKRNIARSTFTLAKADGGGYMLTPDKSNFTAKQDTLCYAVEFEGEDGPVSFEQVDTTDGRMAGAYSNMSSYDVTLAAIKELADEDRPVMPKEIVEWRDEHEVEPIKKGTVRNHFTVLKKRGKIELEGGGALLASSEDQAEKPVHDGEETDASTMNEDNRPDDEQAVKKTPSDPHSHHSHSVSDREGVNDSRDSASTFSSDGDSSSGETSTGAPILQKG